MLRFSSSALQNFSRPSLLPSSCSSSSSASLRAHKLFHHYSTSACALLSPIFSSSSATTPSSSITISCTSSSCACRYSSALSSSSSSSSSSLARTFSTQIVQHRPSAHNSPDVPFAFTPENQLKIREILAKFPSNYKASAVMPLLTLAQEQNQNWLPLSAMNHVAALLDMPPIRVYEVATFYSMYNREPVAPIHVQLCGTTPCMISGSEALKQAIFDKYGVLPGETSSDGQLTLSEVECLGACSNAPMIQVNHHEFYENLTPTSVIQVLEKLIKGEKVKEGPQNGQFKSNGILGKTALKDWKDEETFTKFRNLDQVKKDYEAEQAAKAAAAKEAAANAAPKK